MLTAAPQTYWDDLYQDRPLAYEPDEVLFKEVFKRYLPRGGECFEVGCYPGNFLAYLGLQFDYTVSGIDATPAVATCMLPLLADLGVKVGDLVQGDFFDWQPDRQYDVVCSFGFVEHFPDTAEVLRCHARLVAPGGRLVISCPNFRRCQWLLHRWLDPVNLARHVTGAMDLSRWQAILNRAGFTTRYAGYYRTFDFWTEDAVRHPFNRFAKRAIVRAGRAIDRRIQWPSRWFSPHQILVAQRNR
jgi:SAM-dependent methyltransferase